MPTTNLGLEYIEENQSAKEVVHNENMDALDTILSFIQTGVQGDILYRNASGWVRLAAGTAGQKLMTGGSSANPSWVTDTKNIEIVIDGGGSAITTGIKLDLRFDFNAVITGHVVLADQTGSIVVDLWKDTYANFPPTNADSITASAKPTISSASKAVDTTLTGWTTTITAGDIMRVNVDSCTTITRITLCLSVRKTN